MTRILFVCTGNTCRSPMAQVIAQREIDERGLTGLEVASAGISAREGDDATHDAQAVAAEHGLSLSVHRARRLTRELTDWADLVVGMEQAHVDRAMQLGVRQAIMLRQEPVPDPIGRGGDSYREVWELFEQHIPGMLETTSEGVPGRPGAPPVV